MAASSWRGTERAVMLAAAAAGGGDVPCQLDVQPALFTAKVHGRWRAEKFENLTQPMLRR